MCRTMQSNWTGHAGDRVAEGMARFLRAGRNRGGNLARPAVRRRLAGCRFLDRGSPGGHANLHEPGRRAFHQRVLSVGPGLVPWHQAEVFAVLIGATALIGAIISTYITIQVVRTDMTSYVEDYFAYGLL